MVLALTSSASAEQARHADPLVQAVRGPWPIVALSLVTCAVWIGRWRPSRAHVLRALRWAAVGAAAAAAIALVMRAALGSTLPAFIPPEESAKPGLLLGLSAGVVEEVLFRLMALPAAFALARRRIDSAPVAAGVAAVVTGLLFALSHELTATPFHGHHFAVRVLFPGTVMSLLYFRLAPAFIITAHCTAHLFIPFLFV